MKANLHKQLKRTLWASSLCLAFLLPLNSEALTVQEVPNPRQVDGGWVTDLAEILTDSTEAQLNQMIEQLEATNGAEIAVVTVPLTAPAATPKEFTTELFNYWGIGKKELDNGVLFLISYSDRRVEIETGYGVEGMLPDAKVGRIIDNKITPRFKQGDFDGGTLAGTQALVFALEGGSFPTSDQLPQNLPLYWILVAGGSILALGIGTAVYMSRRVFIQPRGKSRFSKDNRIFLCANCHKRMKQLAPKVLESHLTKPQQVAQKIGSVSFEGWQCPYCSQQLDEDNFHLVAYQSSSPRFRRCPTCDELTIVKHTKRILKRATRSSQGKHLIVEECYCCDYRQEKEETIPRLPPVRDSRIVSSGGSSSGGSSSAVRDSWIVSSGGDSFGGGSSGGGSFGGGSSGGGGAGGDW